MAAGWKQGPPKDFAAQVGGWMDAASTPGVWVTWLERGKVAWEQGIGVRSAATKQSIDSQTIFEAASLTKQITAYVAHALHQEGLLDWDKPLNDFTGGLEGAAATVTARHVLSHSSGFPNWRFKPEEKLVPEFTPGERFRYSGEGYVYLARVIEKITDTAFGDVVQQRVFDRIGMASSSIMRLEEHEGRMAYGHDRRGMVRDMQQLKRFREVAKAIGKPPRSWRHQEMERALERAGTPVLPNYMLPNASASLCTTGPDYAKFVLAAIRNPELRKPVTVIKNGIGWSLGWGLGWGIEQLGGRSYLWQWGDNGGYKNFVIVDPVAETGVFIFTNGDGGMRVADRVVTHATGVEHPALLWLG